jgi:hypothetical protein
MNANGGLVILFCSTLRSIVVWSEQMASGIIMGGHLGVSRWSLHRSFPAIAYISIEISVIETNALLIPQVVPHRVLDSVLMYKDRADS